MTTVNVDNDGNLLVAGRFDQIRGLRSGSGRKEYTSPGAGDAVFMKLSPDGDLIWVKVFTVLTAPGLSVRGRSINRIIFFIGGLVLGTFDSDPSAAVHNLVSAGDWDLWFAKFEPDGDFINAVRQAVLVTNSGKPKAHRG